MENTPRGIVESKLDLKKSASRLEISDGISNSADGKLRNPEIKMEKTSRIPVAIKRNGPNGLRRRQTTKTSLKQPPSHKNKTLSLHAKTTDNRRIRARSISGKNLSSDQEESHRRLDGVNDAVIEDLSVKVVANSEIDRYGSDAVFVVGECARKFVGKAEVIDLDGDINDRTFKTFSNSSERTQKNKAQINPIKSSPDHNQTMSSAVNSPCNNQEKHFLSQSDSSSNVTNNNTVDFIEMLTLDAKEFLSTKCVCTIQTASLPNFCKDCFKNAKVILSDRVQINPDVVNDSSANDEKILTCELTKIDNGLPNNGKQKDCDETSENICANCNEIEFKPISSQKHEENSVVGVDDEEQISYNENNNRMSKESMADFMKPLQIYQLSVPEEVPKLETWNSLECSDGTNKPVRSPLKQAKCSLSTTSINESFNSVGKCCFDDSCNETLNQSSTIELVPSTLGSCEDSSSESSNQEFICSNEKKSSTVPLDRVSAANNNLSDSSSVLSSNQIIYTCKTNIVERNLNHNLSTSYSDMVSSSVFEENLENSPSPEKLLNTTSTQLDNPLFNNELFEKPQEENFYSQNTQANPLSSDQVTKKNSENVSIASRLSTSDASLDPKSVLQHIVNPAGPFPNSSETFPSSSSHRQQRSAYGESCASSESIGGDERPREQAPIRSRESAADVVVSDAPGRRVSQDFNSAADSFLLTETLSDANGFCPKEDSNCINPNKHVQHLSWGFKNGRLVFAESKSNLEESRLHQEQVVCAGGDHTLNVSSDKSTEDQVLTLNPKTLEGHQTVEGSSTGLEPPVFGAVDTILNPKGLLSSKDINKRSEDSRLKHLENKLKKAGIVDAKNDLNTTNNQSADANCANNNNTNNNCTFPNESSSNFAKTHQYTSKSDNTDQNKSSLKLIGYSEFQKECAENSETPNNTVADKENNIEGEDLIPDGSHEFCQFDVSDFSGFSSFSANQPLGVYDEFIEDSSSDDSCGCDEEEHFIVIRRMRGDGIAMVNDSSERNKHNPDRDNLKSLLKKPGRAKDKKSNRVVFNENKNEFFDADYIILIREDCELDDDDEDGVCTCQQHEMVRLTCCEPNCNCQYDGGMEQTPQSPKFAPPMEFVDAVTLSPPEGYKDMELMAGRGQQRGAVCRECSATHDEEMEEEGEVSQSDSEMDGQMRQQEEKEKTDQSQQTTPTTPPSSDNSSNQNYILETLTTTKVTQQQILREAENSQRPLPSNQGSPISGILKGGRLWKQQSQPSAEVNFLKQGDLSSDSVASDDESNNRRSVRFIESEEKEKRDSCDGAPESSPEEEIPTQKAEMITESQMIQNDKQEMYTGTSPDAPEMTLTFKLGNHVLISNNSLKPNSAVRQLFPCTKSLAAAQGVQEEENSQQYLVTAESLRAFEEAKRSKLPQIIQSGETDETIKRAIERNTLRRSLIRYEPRSKKQPYKSDNSLVERIKQLTCDVEDSGANSEQNHQQSSIEPNDQSEDVLDSRSSPPGEESRSSPDVNSLSANKSHDKSFSPSSSSTASSNSSMSINQNYHQARKLSGTGEQALMLLDPKRVENVVPDIQNNFRREIKPLPDIGGPHNHDLCEPARAMANPPDLSHCVISNKMSSSSTTSESRRQFLSTLAPLTACVTMGVAHNEDYYYHLTKSAHHHNQPGERISMASSGTEYSLEDIDEGLKTEDEEQKRIAPDVLAGTPSASESGDELAMFVQQDAGRIERIKKKYQPAEQPKENKNNDEDDEHDDYGFNRRPSVRGIKPRFSTTTEILQQIQNQLQPPAPPSSRVAWPYYSESGLTDNSKQKNANQNTPSSNYQYINVAEEVKTRGYPPQYRPTSLQEESLYQNCANQRCVSKDMYQRSNANVYSSVIRMGNDYYQSLPVRQRNGRPQSPPPMDMSKQYHQTMVYIPYNHIEGYQPVQYYHAGTSDYVARVSSQNQINKRYIEPVYQSRVHHHVDDHHYNPNMIPPVPPKTLNRVPYPNGQPPPHMMGGSRSESPLPGQFSTARSTQTPAPTMSTCNYYPSNPRYRPMVGPVWQGEGNYATKVNRHSFPSVGPRYPPADSISLTDSDSQHSGSLPNGYRQSDISLYASKDSIPNSPTKPRFIERGVPEGAASVSPQDLSGVSQSSSSTMTSPNSPQNPPVPTNQKAMFYAMNV